MQLIDCTLSVKLSNRIVIFLLLFYYDQRLFIVFMIFTIFSIIFVQNFNIYLAFTKNIFFFFLIERIFSRYLIIIFIYVYLISLHEFGSFSSIPENCLYFYADIYFTCLYLINIFPNSPRNRYFKYTLIKLVIKSTYKSLFNYYFILI